MGLGSYPAVSLEEARRKAREAAALVAKGIDPRLARREDPANLTFRDAAEAYLVEALPRYPSAKSKCNLAARASCSLRSTRLPACPRDWNARSSPTS